VILVASPGGNCFFEVHEAAVAGRLRCYDVWVLALELHWRELVAGQCAVMVEIVYLSK
jgi:hypothetical protein